MEILLLREDEVYNREINVRALKASNHSEAFSVSDYNLTVEFIKNRIIHFLMIKINNLTCEKHRVGHSNYYQKLKVYS